MTPVADGRSKIECSKIELPRVKRNAYLLEIETDVIEMITTIDILYNIWGNNCLYESVSSVHRTGTNKK